MQENEERPPEEAESGLSSVVWGWALWAVIVMVFAVWGGVRALMPDEASTMARAISGIEQIAPAAGPSAADESAPRPDPDAD